MATYDFDLFVIGAGSGGVRAARMAAGKGIRVAIAEDRYLGGTCVNVGCVPKKLFVYASQFSESFVGATGFGWQNIQPEFNWSTLVENKNKEISRLQNVYDGLLQNSDVKVINGRAKLIDGHTVIVGNQQYTAERIILATGGWPFVPEIQGKEHIVTSNEIFNLSTLPKRIIIVGGGYIAVEFAGILNGLGVHVKLIERHAKILRGFDEDVRDFLTQEMIKKRIDFRFDTTVGHIERKADVYVATTSTGESIESDLIMYATGRVPNSKNLGLEEVGIETDDVGAIVVNDLYQTNVDSIYAIGDVTNRVNLTPVATSEAMSLIKKLYFESSSSVDYDNIPTAVFSQPNVSTVGLSEQAARTLYGNDIEIYKSTFKAMKNTMSGIDEKTFMKMIVVRSTDKVVGMHMVGADAGEIIQGFAVAMRAGATKSIFDSTIGIHPTAAEEFVTMRTPFS
jgi:glutathione reductase (NADPH)